MNALHDREDPFTYLDLSETGDYDLDRDLERGLDGRIEYNEDDPNVMIAVAAYYDMDEDDDY